jgi:hypothetical protein
VVVEEVFLPDAVEVEVYGSTERLDERLELVDEGLAQRAGYPELVTGAAHRVILPSQVAEAAIRAAHWPASRS